MNKYHPRTPRAGKALHALLIAGAAFSPTMLHAVDRFWDGTTGAYGTATNWSDDAVPGAGDQAFVDNGGTAEIGMSESFTTDRLRLGTGSNTGNLSISGGTLTLTGDGHTTYIGGDDVNGNGLGTGTVTISNGGALIGTGGGEMLFGSRGGVGNLMMTGGTLSNNNWIIFGRDGDGTANVHLSGNATIQKTGGGNIAVAIFSGTTSTVTMSDTSSMLSNNEIRIGWGNNGFATKGVLHMSGNSSAHSDGNFNIAHTEGGANGPTGEVNLSEGAAISTNQTLQLGLRGGANGTLTMGGTSTATAGNEFYVGSEAGATGTLTMGDNSKVTVTNGFVVGRFNSTGLATVNGNAEIEIGGVNVIGDGGSSNGTLVMNGGSYVHSTYQLWLGLNQSNSTVTINGGRLVANPVLDPMSPLFDATGAGVSFSRFGSGGNGVLNLNGGILETPGFSRYGGAAQINLNGGTIKATGMTTTGSFFDNIASNEIDVQAGGAIFDTNGNDITVVQDLAGVGGLTKQGDGALILTGASTYGGATVIEGGSIVLGSSQRISDSSAVTLDGGTLNLNNFNETLAALTLDSTSTIDFGATPGANTLIFANSSAMTWSGSLILSNFEVGVDTLNFSDGSGLTISQLSAISLAGYQATGLTGAGDVIFAAVPEPGYGVAIMTTLGGLLCVRNRRRRQTA